MKHTLGSAGFLGRWAEDEFLVIMPNCGTAELEKAGDDIRKIVNSSRVQWWGDSLSDRRRRHTSHGVSGGNYGIDIGTRWMLPGSASLKQQKREYRPA
jgi:GGDEF domain-containing protein